MPERPIKLAVEGLHKTYRTKRPRDTFLRRLLPDLNLARFFLATLLVAGLGWAAASAPAVLSSDSGGSQPPQGLVLLGAAGLGLVMGPVLGGAQALALRGAVRHPWRWVGANTAAWPFVMVVIFLGATAPAESWSTASVVALGALTGLVAGAVLGALTWPFLESLSGQPIGNRVVLAVLESRWGGRTRESALGLEVTGRRTGRAYRFPVHYAELDTGELLVVPGHPDRKTWWTNLGHDAAPVRILHGADWEPAYASLLLPDDVLYPSARHEYERRWPHIRLPLDQPLVSIRPVARGIPVPGRVLEHVDC